MKIYLASIVCAYMIGVAVPCSAVIYNYSGTVVEATGAFGQLIPVGTPITGYMVFADAAVEAGFVGVNDLEDLVVQVGGFCVYLQDFNCLGVAVPLDSIDSVEITFDLAGNVTVGEIIGVTFVPTDPVIPWLFDFDTNTLVAGVPDFGVLTANTTLVPAIPIPGAIWLFCSATLCLVGRHRHMSIKYRYAPAL